jgi:hypothetical protein
MKRIIRVTHEVTIMGINLEQQIILLGNEFRAMQDGGKHDIQKQISQMVQVREPELIQKLGPVRIGDRIHTTVVTEILAIFTYLEDFEPVSL